MAPLNPPKGVTFNPVSGNSGRNRPKHPPLGDGRGPNPATIQNPFYSLSVLVWGEKGSLIGGRGEGQLFISHYYPMGGVRPRLVLAEEANVSI